MGDIFDEPVEGATTIWEDKHSAIAYSQNALVSEKPKHIDVLKSHFLKDHVEHGIVRLRYMPTDRMVADMFTKPMS
jgi:KUP system potassium uptake protein